MSGERLVLRRLLSEKSLLLAACATALFATTVLALLSTYTRSVTQEGLRRTLSGATFESAGTRVTAQVDGGAYARADRSLREVLHRAYGDIPLTIMVRARADSYALPGQEKLAHPQLTTFAMYSGLEQHATLTAGAWPRPAGPVAEAVLPASAARAMKTAVGDVLTLHSRLDHRTVRVKVTGVFRVDRPGDYFWQGDRLVTTGTERLGYTTLGPLVLPPATFTRIFAGTGFSAGWLVRPDFRAVSAGELRSLGPRLDTLSADLRSGRAGHQFLIATRLPELVRQVGDALVVARSTMLIPVLQLIVLAGYALTLVARLLAEHRRTEMALLRARGAAAGQLSRLTLAEGALLTAPGAVCAPLLTRPLLDLLGGTPIIRASGLRLDFRPSILPWVASFAAALVCAVALTAPTLRGITTSYVATRTARGRGERRGALQRAGGDLALLVVAALAVWQLTRYGGPVTATPSGGGGTGGIDPFLVTGPALALLVGGMLVLRLVPIASGAAERITARGRGLVGPLGARQVSRRPLRYAGPVLLLVMATAVGVLAVAAGGTWRRSQVEQADFQAGTDLRVTVPSGTSGPSPLGRGGWLAGLPTVTALSPVLRQSATSGGEEVTVVAGDAAAMGSLLRTRADLFARGAPAKLLAPPTRPALAVLPGRPGRLAFDLRLIRKARRSAAGTGTSIRISVTVVDGMGVAQDLDLGALPADGRTRTRVIDTAGLAGPGGRLTFPLGIRSVHYELGEGWQQPPRDETFELGVLRIQGGSARGWDTPLRVTGAETWRSFAGERPSSRRPGVVSRDGAFLTMILRTTGSLGPYQHTPVSTGHAVLISPADRTAPDAGASGPPGLAPIPGIITADLAHRARVGLGGTVTVSQPGGEQPIKVVGVAAALPSTPPGRPAVLVDLPTLTDRLLSAGGTVPQPGEWWLATAGGGTATAARALAVQPDWTRELVDRIALRKALRDAPLGAALQGSLLIGFAAALAFVVIGFAVNATVSARERAGELAVLRGLGVRRGEIYRLLGLEQAFLVALGAIGGTVLGIVVAHLVVPRVVLNVRTGAPYPAVDTVISWRPLLGLLGAVVLILVTVLALLVRSLRRRGFGGTAGIGEDG